MFHDGAVAFLKHSPGIQGTVEVVFQPEFRSLFPVLGYVDTGTTAQQNRHNDDR
jgi:hypothetical protein